MAEVIENPTVVQTHTKYASNSKANAGLTLGIIGTALAGLNTLGGIGALSGVFSGTPGGRSSNNNSNITNEELYLERRLASDELFNTQARFANYTTLEKEITSNKMDENDRIAQSFFESYQRDVDNSFNLYKYNRDTKDELAQKIAEVDKKVEIMAAIKPYENALIAQKMDYNLLKEDFNLATRTSRMIEGQLVLPTGTVNKYCPPYIPWSGVFSIPDTSTN